MNTNPDLKTILVIDIETVACSESYESMPERLKPLWLKKAGTFRNDEALTAEELFETRAGIFAEFGKIVTIAMGVFTSNDAGETGFRVKALANDDEAVLLQEFKQFVETKFKNVQLALCAHNGKEFDFPYLCRRMLINCIPIPEVLNLSGKKPWEIPHLDTLEMWKFGDRKSFTSLELLASIFGIDSSKDDIDGSMVNSVYYQEKDLEKIARYCKQDVIVTAQLYLKLLCLPSIEAKDIIIL